MANLGADRIVTGVADTKVLATIGATTASEAQLESLADQVTSVRQFSRAADAFAGSYLTVGTIDGQTYASGPAMESRRLWTARIDGVHVVSDRADVLAELGGFELDPTALALRMLPSLPHPLDRTSMWKHIAPLAGGQYVTTSRDGTRTTEGTWWQMPTTEMTRAEGARMLREEMQSAVSARATSRTAMACDLSGGLDSTPLCYFAAQTPEGILARTLYNDDPGGTEDLQWAKKALTSMPGVHTHTVLSTEEMQDFYEGIDRVSSVLDEPTQAATAAPRILALLEDDRRRGITSHITGLGGDHILRGVDGWEHTLARSKPWLAWKRARAQHIPNGVSPVTTVRQLIDRRSYRQWLQDVTHAAAKTETGAKAPGLNDWSSPVSFPPWMSPHARELVVDKITSVLPSTEPLAEGIAAHTDVYFVRDAARLTRGTAQLGHHLGVSYDSPLLDDRVANAAFAVRREERDTPLEWKPLMKEAMRGLLPDDYLMRTNKVGGGPQSVRGYARNYDTLLELMSSSGLLDTGLIDEEQLLNSTRPSDRATPEPHVHQAINASVFMRNMTKSPALANT